MTVIFLTWVQHGAWPLRMVGAVRIFLALQAYRDILRIFLAQFADYVLLALNALEVASVNLHARLVESQSVDMIGELIFHDGVVNCCGVGGRSPMNGHGDDAVAPEGVRHGGGLCAEVTECDTIPRKRQLAGHQGVVEFCMGDRIDDDVKMHSGLAAVIGDKERILEIDCRLGDVQIREIEARIGSLRGAQHGGDSIIVERTDMCGNGCHRDAGENVDAPSRTVVSPVGIELESDCRLVDNQRVYGRCMGKAG